MANLLHVSEFSALGSTQMGDSVAVVDSGAHNVDQEISSAATSGPIGSLHSLTGGTGYTAGTYDQTPLTGGHGSGATAKIVVGNNVGQILTLGAIVGGALYTTGTYNGVPLSYVTTGAGTGATANVTVAGGVVTAVTVVNGGIGYSVADSLTVVAADIGGTGTGFHVPVATIGNGAVTTVTLESPGTGYEPADSLSASAAIIGSGGTSFAIVVNTVNTVSQPFQSDSPATFGPTGQAVGSAQLATRWLLITAGAACSIAIGLNPVAVVGGWFMAAGSQLLVRVPANQGWSISFIADTP
jgi:hypothetical protein